MTRINSPTFGADIEYFIQTAKGELFPAIGLIGGSKEEPKPLGDGYFVQEDNVAVEFNIPICKTPREWVKAVELGFIKSRGRLPPTFYSKEGASGIFAAEYLNSPEARTFGCEPDINAWTRRVNPRPQATNPLLRSCGGHVHIGWEKPDLDTRFELIKACDVFVSLPSLLEDRDTERRKLYGKAGACRIKDYGVEHRVLSNYWLFNSDYATTVITRYSTAIDFINKGLTIDEEDNAGIIAAINESNVDQGITFWNKYKQKLGIPTVEAKRGAKKALNWNTSYTIGT